MLGQLVRDDRFLLGDDPKEQETEIPRFTDCEGLDLSLSSLSIPNTTDRMDHREFTPNGLSRARGSRASILEPQRRRVEMMIEQRRGSIRRVADNIYFL